jgi:hypothetical protein
MNPKLGVFRQWAVSQQAKCFNCSKLNYGRCERLVGWTLALTLREGVFQMTNRMVKLARGKGLACYSLRIVPPASEREARMDDPTRWCENDTGN